MFIETQATPNPETLKFLPEQVILEVGSAHFSRDADYSQSPLAAMLFGLPSVAAVFLGYDYVSVTKSPDSDWSALKAEVIGHLMTFLASGEPALLGDAKQELVVEDKEGDREIIEQIQDLLSEKVRPAVAGDGGDIVYRGFADGIVYLEMQGACAGCPSSTITLKHGIENLLKYYVPEVTGVEPV